MKVTDYCHIFRSKESQTLKFMKGEQLDRNNVSDKSKKIESITDNQIRISYKTHQGN